MNPAPSAPTATSHKVALYVLGSLLLAGVIYAGLQLREQNRRLEQTAEQMAARDADLKEILGEVTRLRIEQSTGIQGPQALLEKLKVYAPTLVSARTPEPDYQSARKEMVAILRAFESLGQAAWKPVIERIDKLHPSKNYDELKWLLEAAVVIDKKPGLELAEAVVMGRKLPSPRLRWHAADVLLRNDASVARQALRRVLLTESSRGVNIERATAYGMPIPDKAAVATTGFHNFVVKYTRSGDSEMDDTLLMVMGRTEQDLMTVQECVKSLGESKCERAIPAIEKLFQDPPGFQHNPLFQLKCLDALANIQGEKARPFFEKMLPDATTETVAKHLKRLLSQPIQQKTAQAPKPPKKK